MLLTVESFVAMFGEEECLQIAGVGSRDDRRLDYPKIEEALDHAGSLVLGYVRDRWPSALDHSSPMLEGFAGDVARWRLRGRGGQQTAMNETVQKRYDEAIARLKDIAAGKLTLDLPASDADADAFNENRVSAVMPEQRTQRILQGYRP